MKKPLHVAMSPITGTIFAGTILKDGWTWSADKQDVTLEALIAVAQHLAHLGNPIDIVREDGRLEYRIMVEHFMGNETE